LGIQIIQSLLKFFTPLGLPDIEDEDEDVDSKNINLNLSLITIT
jgi:hypothetical protein